MPCTCREEIRLIVSRSPAFKHYCELHLLLTAIKDKVWAFVLIENQGVRSMSEWTFDIGFMSECGKLLVQISVFVLIMKNKIALSGVLGLSHKFKFRYH